MKTKTLKKKVKWALKNAVLTVDQKILFKDYIIDPSPPAKVEVIVFDYIRTIERKTKETK